MRAWPKTDCRQFQGTLGGTDAARSRRVFARLGAQRVARNRPRHVRDASRVETRGERRSQRARGVDSGNAGRFGESGREARVRLEKVRETSLETSRALASDDMSAASSAAFDAKEERQAIGNVLSGGGETERCAAGGPTE